MAKALGIQLQKIEPYRDAVGTGEAIFPGQAGDPFVEEPPRVIDALRGFPPSRTQFTEYFLSLFPFISWIGHYNLQWLIGDLVAGKLSWCRTRACGKAAHKTTQVSPSEPWLFLRAWPMLSWPTLKFNLDYTPHLWASSFSKSHIQDPTPGAGCHETQADTSAAGFLPHQRISP